MQFADIVEVGGDKRVSGFNLPDSVKGGLEVRGVLPHGYRFEPCSVTNANKLIEWLEAWKGDPIDRAFRAAWELEKAGRSDLAEGIRAVLEKEGGE